MITEGNITNYYADLEVFGQKLGLICNVCGPMGFRGIWPDDMSVDIEPGMPIKYSWSCNCKGVRMRITEDIRQLAGVPLEMLCNSASCSPEG